MHEKHHRKDSNGKTETSTVEQHLERPSHHHHFEIENPEDSNMAGNALRMWRVDYQIQRRKNNQRSRNVVLSKTLKNQLDRKDKQQEYVRAAKYKHTNTKHD